MKTSENFSETGEHRLNIYGLFQVIVQFGQIFQKLMFSREYVLWNGLEYA